MVVSLTSLSHGAGCGCKLPAAAIGPLLASLPPGAPDPNVLVGFDTADDAGVYRLRDDLALVHTVDFFTPIVDDPFDFGRIAATNALSDIYAMGAQPVSALNLVAFSLAQLGEEPLREILRGGAAVAADAGVAILGGHSIEDSEPKYGMAVTGIVHPDELLTNAGGRAGDALVLTKPLGAGAVSTALKRGVPAAPLAEAVEVMTTLNREGAAAARAAGAHALTDVTGFGLLGHLHELALASGLAAEVQAGAVPAIDGVLELLADDAERAVAGGTRRNRDHAMQFATFAASVPPAQRWLVCDAMTSGGLLAAVPAAAAASMPGSVIGRLVDGPSRDDHCRLIAAACWLWGAMRPKLSRTAAPDQAVWARGAGSGRPGPRERVADHEPADEPDGVGQPARLGDHKRHQRDDDRDRGGREQVSLDLLARAQRQQIGDRPRNHHRQRRAVCPEHDRYVVGGNRQRGSADAADEEQGNHRNRPMPALEQRAIDRNRGQRDERVARVAVGERSRYELPPVRPGLANDGDVAQIDQRGPPDQAPDEPERDQRNRRVRVRFGADPRDLARLQPRQRGRRRTAAAALGHAPIPVELGGPLA